jgi:hypothetical protein
MTVIGTKRKLGLAALLAVVVGIVAALAQGDIVHTRLVRLYKSLGGG